ncbi:diguanylate cyclase [Candidatus Saccharibacteria bacterium]|nr:diguanylate cyclase [Candidatus Saccharibacteria bacterium]
MLGEAVIEQLNKEFIVGRRRILKSAKKIGGFVVDGMQNVLDVLHEGLGNPGYGILHDVARISEVSECKSRYGLLVEMDKKMRDDEAPLKAALLTYVDIKDFKIPNDKYGESFGDVLLTVTGWGLREIFRDPEQLNKDAMVARWGGDEFMSVQPADAHMNEALFGGSLRFFGLSGHSGLVTWHFDQYIKYLHANNLHQDSEIYDALSYVVGHGVDQLTYRYTFDTMDISPFENASDAIDSFALTNTIKATHLRRPTS